MGCGHDACYADKDKYECFAASQLVRRVHPVTYIGSYQLGHRFSMQISQVKQPVEEPSAFGEVAMDSTLPS